MDKIKQNIDLQEAIQRYNIEKSVVGTLAYNIDQNLQKGMSPDEAIENVLQKSKKANVGEVHTWNGKRYKKQSNGKWLEVSEHDRTHSFLMETSAILKRKAQERRDFGIPYAAGEYEKDSIYWKEQASKLSDKEYEDHEIGLGGEKKEATAELGVHKKGDKLEHNGETIHVGHDTSGGQSTITYKAPSVSDKTYYDLDKLKKVIEENKVTDEQRKTIQDRMRSKFNEDKF
jgi:hypothetical protein